MEEGIKNVKISLNPIDVSDDGNLYKVTVQIPTKLGWIEDVKFILDFNFPKQESKLNFIKEENGNAIFETEVYLPTRAIYLYYLSCKINGNLIYLKNNYSNLNEINSDECYKISVNFDVPDWAKGAVM